MQIVEGEAETVLTIFRRYLELGSVHVLARELEAGGVRSRSGAVLTRGAVFHLLKNRLYLGEIVHKTQVYPGRHPPIVDRELFEEVQRRLVGNRQGRQPVSCNPSGYLLTGRLFDGSGVPLSPASTRTSSGRTYRYYVSSAAQQGKAKGKARRLSAPVLERALLKQLALASEAPVDTDYQALMEPVRRVEVLDDQLLVTVERASATRSLRSKLRPHPSDASTGVLELAVQVKVRGGRSWALAPGGGDTVRRKDPVLIAGLRRAVRLANAMGWRLDGKASEAEAHQPSSAYERKLVRLAFLSPELQTAILEGRQPKTLTLQTLLNAEIPVSWDAQAALWLQ